MKNLFLILIFLFGLLTSVNSQNNINQKEMVGFGCSYSGTPSKSVSKITSILINEDYNAIASMLTSKNNAERYLAVISLEKLAKLKKYELTDEQKVLITKIYNSNELVSVCSGCTYFDKIALKELFYDERENIIKSSAKYWLKKYIKKK